MKTARTAANLATKLAKTLADAVAATNCHQLHKISAKATTAAKSAKAAAAYSEIAITDAARAEAIDAAFAFAREVSRQAGIASEVAASMLPAA